MKTSVATVFPPTTESDWRQKISVDLKGRSLDDVLSWTAEPELVLEAVATRESGYHFPNQLFPHDEKWEILETLRTEADDDATVLDIRPLMSSIGSLSDQCAVAAAMLVEHLRNADPSAILARAVVPVSPQIVLEVGKLRALRLLLEEALRVWIEHGRRSSREGSTGSVGRVSIWSVAADRCRCPDRETHQIRLTYATLGALLGGSNAILPSPFDDAADSVRLARNVLLILRHESNLPAIQSVANGSYYLNQVSTRIYRTARSTLLQILSEGGLSAVAQNGALEAVLSTGATDSGAGND